jgi:hypothetical protein
MPVGVHGARVDAALTGTSVVARTSSDQNVTLQSRRSMGSATTQVRPTTSSNTQTPAHDLPLHPAPHTRVRTVLTGAP